MRFCPGCPIIIALFLASAPLRAATLGSCPAAERLGTQAGSSSCLTCHDDALAPGISTARGQDTATGRTDHPVRVSYREAYARNPRMFHRPEEVERRLSLPEGKVECVTCHQPNAEGRWTVAAAGPGRPLCGGCHRQ